MKPRSVGPGPLCFGKARKARLHRAIALACAAWARGMEDRLLGSHGKIRALKDSQVGSNCPLVRVWGKSPIFLKGRFR